MSYLSELADITGTRVPGIFRVAPRYASPSWDYLPVTPSKTRPAARWSGTYVPGDPMGLAADLGDSFTVHPWSHLVPGDVVAASLDDPGAFHSVAAALEHAATAFLHEHGEVWPRPDTFDRKHRRYHVRPDRVATHGTPRYVAPSPVRQDHVVTERTPVGIDGQAEMITRETWRTFCTCGEATRAYRTAASLSGAERRAHLQDRRRTCPCEARGWIGHRRTVFARTVAATRAVRRSERAKVTTARRGPIAGASPWTMSARSLLRASARVRSTVAELEAVLRTSAVGAVVTFGPVTVEILDGASVTYRDRAYPVREWARRAALAGVNPRAI